MLPGHPTPAFQFSRKDLSSTLRGPLHDSIGDYYEYRNFCGDVIEAYTKRDSSCCLQHPNPFCIC